jgi:hypothetical protein
MDAASGEVKDESNVASQVSLVRTHIGTHIGTHEHNR